jgi:uncharacterized PurR-regulated membrane protein YhhQ (DUF165 family)
MRRIEFIKRDKWRVLFLLAFTAVLPFMAEWHNPAGAQPIEVFGFLAVIGWLGFIGMMLLTDSLRAKFFDS